MSDDRLSRGSWFSGLGAILTFACFFLPWVTVSIVGQPVVSLSGFDLAQGVAGGIDAQPALYLVIAAAMLSLGVLAYTYQRGYSDVATAGTQLLLALIGYAPLLGLYLSLRSRSQPGVPVSATPQLGLWGTMLGLLMIAIGGIIDLISPAVEPRPPIALPPTERAAPPPPSAPPPTPRIEPTRRVEERAPAMAWLVIKSGPRPGQQFGLTRGRNTIGRDGTRCDIVLDDGAVSAEHARINFENGQFVIYDLASLNGTFVNRQRVQRQLLMDGDLIRLGNTTLVFKKV